MIDQLQKFSTLFNISVVENWFHSWSSAKIMINGMSMRIQYGMFHKVIVLLE